MSIASVIEYIDKLLWGWPLSSTIGTGYIIGVGTAIVLGGPGAVLFLSGMIARETKRYSGKHLEDKDESDIPVVKNSRKGVLG